MVERDGAVSSLGETWLEEFISNGEGVAGRRLMGGMDAIPVAAFNAPGY